MDPSNPSLPLRLGGQYNCSSETNYMPFGLNTYAYPIPQPLCNEHLHKTRGRGWGCLTPLIV